MTTSNVESDLKGEANLDPLSGKVGAHPVGTGLGATAGAVAAGAAAGSIAGPAGTVVGAVVGAVAGGLAGKEMAERIDPTSEEAYWRENYSSRNYVNGGASFDDYGPAYRYGYDAYGRREGRTFEQAEPELMRDWQQSRGKSELTWESAKAATHDSWRRLDAIERAVHPEDSNRDGN
jgi:hypothetical protein